MINCQICQQLVPQVRSKTRKYCSVGCQQKAYRQRDPDRWSGVLRRFYEMNKAYFVEKTCRRQRTVRQSPLFTAYRNDTKEIYIRAQTLGLEVDHIVPLHHPDVSGLHVPWNLQLLSRQENAKKGNRYD